MTAKPFRTWQLDDRRVGRGSQAALLRLLFLLFLGAAPWEAAAADIDWQFAPTHPSPAAPLRVVYQPQPQQPAEPAPLSELLELPLEELARQRVAVPGPPPATLTAIEPAEALVTAAPGESLSALPRTVPAAVTRIDYETLWASGARTFEEAIEIYVPNVEFIRHHSQPAHLGIRGIISDRDNKYLLRVNDRIMNQRALVGAFSERWLPLTGDIHHIDVVRGPASATYGPGAISGVVNIATHNGLTFQGLDATVREGFIEDYTATEIRFGRQFDDDTGLFAYFGFADYRGADQDDSPYVIGRTFTTGDGTLVRAGEPVPFSIPKDHRGYRSQPFYKAHAQYTDGPLDVWVRYTRGGEQTTIRRSILEASRLNDLQTEQAGYQQITMYGVYTWELNDDFNIEFALSYDMFDFERLTDEANGLSAFREDEYYSRVLARWTPLESHSLAFGFAYSHEVFGLPSPGFPGRLPASIGGGAPPSSIPVPWQTNTYSVLGEYQWQIDDQWTAFLSGRTDDHTFTEVLFSPRAAVVYAATDADTIKFIAARSLRRAEDAELQREFVATGNTAGQAEVVRGYELRYERQQSDPLWLGLSAFYEDTDSIGFDGTPGVERSVLLGEFRIWGLELESAYHTENTHFVASHSYTKLIDGLLTGNSDPLDPNATIQGISAAPYGFGNDLANWANNLTKLAIYHDLNCCWTASSSLRVYWDFPGARDLTAFNNFRDASGIPASGRIGFSDPGFSKAFRANAYLNFGLERKLCGNGALRLDLYNVLGWIDKDINKRNYINRVSDYRAEAAAIGLSARFDY